MLRLSVAQVSLPCRAQFYQSLGKEEEAMRSDIRMSLPVSANDKAIVAKERRIRLAFLRQSTREWMRAWRNIMHTKRQSARFEKTE